MEGKEEGQGEDGWIWQEKTWKGLELRKETKSIRRNAKYFRAVVTPNREKPKEEEAYDCVHVPWPWHKRRHAKSKLTRNETLTVQL